MCKLFIMYYSDPDMDSFMICIDDEEAADISEEHRSAYYGYGRADRGASTINEEDRYGYGYGGYRSDPSIDEEDRYNGYGRADHGASTISEEDRYG